MPRRKRIAQRPTIESDDLRALGEAKLAGLLAEQIAALPYHQQKQWARRHLPERPGGGLDAGSQPAVLLDEIEEFCAHSRSGAFVSWQDDRWDDGDDAGDDGEQFEEWIELFNDLMKGALNLTRSGHHTEATNAYRMLLGLLKEAGETTDILGNQGVPEDAIRLDFDKIVEAYTRSLLASRSIAGVDEVIAEILPVAKKFWYSDGFMGLARALDAEGRDRLRARLSKTVEAELKTDRLDCPAEVEGLIALARVRKSQTGVLALKERFADRNATYLKEVLAHHERKRDWDGVARLAQVGIRRFGHHREYATALIKAREALGDRPAAQEAQIAHFLEDPGAAEFVALRRRSESLSNWETVFERLLQASATSQRGIRHPGLRTQLLLAEGREREALDEIAGRLDRMEIEEIKLVAKYAVAKLSAGADLGRFSKLSELQRRLEHEKHEPYDWLRLILKQPGAQSRAEYARLAARAYRRLVDLHLNSGKPSRAAPAAHYCGIVAEISRLLDEPVLWAALLGHLRQHHGKKRLIWEHLKAEGCLPV